MPSQSAHTRSRRLPAALVAVVVAVALSLVAFSGPANATSNSSNAASVLSKFNAARLSHTPAESKLITAPVLSSSTQAYATFCSTNWASCAPGTDMACPGYDCSQPNGFTSDDFGVVRVASGSGATTRAAAALEAYVYDSDSLLTWYGNYGAVGYVTKGSYTYVALEVIEYPIGVPIFTLSGTAAVGSPLSVGHSGFTTEPTSISYQWLADNDPVGTNSATFTPSSAEYNSAISVTISWTWPDAPYTPQETLDSGTVALGTFAHPTTLVTGRLNVGQTLTAAPTSAWTPEPTILHYVWMKDGKPIALATDPTYTIQTGDKGHRIDLEEVAESPAGGDYNVATVKTKTKTKVAGITFGLPDEPSLVDETNDLGPFYHDTLSFTMGGAWSPAPTSLSYQWYRNGKAISGATHSTYKPGTSDIHRIITLKITAHRSGYVSASVTSGSYPAWTVQGLSFDQVGVPTVTGSSFTVGQTLTAHVGTWSPKPTSFSYQWYLDGSPIPHATHSTYKLIAADAGHSVSVYVTGKKTDYENGVTNSDGYPITSP